MEITNTGGKMSRTIPDWGIHGKDMSENQISKKNRKHKHKKLCDPAERIKWNKKKGLLEKTKKGSRIEKWSY